jgi:hypothetical protein
MMPRADASVIRPSMLALAAAALVLALPLPGAAQSLFSAGGLGVPTGAADARARMVGGVGIGLSGGHFSPTDPAAAGWLLLPGISASMESGTESFNGGETSGRTRFPSFGIVYPYRGNVYTAGFTGILSQEWRSEVTRVIDFGDGLLVDAVDRFQSEGGIGSAQVGVARRLGSSLSVGVNAGLYLGSVERLFERELDPTEVGPEVEFFSTRGAWRAEGSSVTASASWEPSSVFRLAAGATWSGDLTLEPQGNTTGEAVVVPLPLELRFGTYVTLTPGLGLAVSVSRADWSEAAAAMEDAGSPGTVTRWGVGGEWNAGTVRGRRIPMALGYRSGDLPFSFLGAAASESAITGGLGIHLAENEGIPLARVEVGFERGSRQAEGAEEDFFRTTVTFRISGR